MITIQTLNETKRFKYSNDLIEYMQDTVDQNIESILDIVKNYNVSWEVPIRIAHYKAMKGNKVSLMVFGQMTTGVVEDIGVRPDCIWIHVKHKSVQWGRTIYTRSSLFERIEDLYGSARYLVLLSDKNSTNETNTNTVN